MKRYDLAVAGAGPAGLSAAIEAAGYGLKVVVFDENDSPGGQLFKQIHKFFGSKEHKARIRGFRIGQELLQQAGEQGVEVVLDAAVTGLYPEKELTVKVRDEVRHYKGDAIIIATGASENMVAFEGWTLPGVIGAGAAQTMMNLQRVRPGKRVLILGSGNVGLVVGYQLLQAGCEVAGICDAAPRIGGYGVHAAKLARCGVPFYMSHTIIRAEGTEQVEGVIIGQTDQNWEIIPGTERHLEVDTICLAAGLTPMAQLAHMAGCEMQNNPGGYAPAVNGYGETSIKGVFAAGDVSGIEEASSAMIEGRIAGTAAAYRLGFIEQQKLEKQASRMEEALESLRRGMFAPENRGRVLKKTEEGIGISKSLLEHGYIAEEEIARFPGVTAGKHMHPVVECTQNIPCNPCQDVCPRNCIRIGADITALPVVDTEAVCTGCGMCVASCSGQAIFLLKEDDTSGTAEITMPYEFLPVPAKGESGTACDRSGAAVCQAEVISVKSAAAFDKTSLLTIRVPIEYSMKARFYRGEAYIDGK